MLLLTPSRALSGAALLALTATVPAAAQTTVHYAWLTPPGELSATMLMLSCPSGVAGPAHLAVVQPLFRGSPETHLTSWDQNTGTGYFDSLADTLRQPAIDSVRARLIRRESFEVGTPPRSLQFRWVDRVDTVTIPPALLARVPKSMTLADRCQDGVSPLTFASADDTSGVIALVRAGEYVFAGRGGPTVSQPEHRFENAIVQLLSGTDASAAKSPDATCPSPLPAWTRPLSDMNAFRARRLADPLTREKVADRQAWTIRNGTFASVRVPVRASVMRGDPRPRVAEETLEIEACGRRLVSFATSDTAGRAPRVTADLDSGRLNVTVTPEDPEVERDLEMAATAEGLQMTLRADGGRMPAWARLAAVFVLGIVFGAGAALVGWTFPRARRTGREGDSARLTQEDIRNPVELALVLQGLPRTLPRPAADLRNAVPTLRRVGRYRLAESRWRRDLWHTLLSTGEMDGLYTRVTGRQRHSRPDRRWRPWKPTSVEEVHGLSPHEEAKLLFLLQEDEHARQNLSDALQREILRFPEQEVAPAWLRRALARAVNGALGDGYLTRDELARTLPRYFAPAPEPLDRPDTGTPLGVEDALRELSGRLDGIVELLRQSPARGGMRRTDGDRTRERAAGKRDDGSERGTGDPGRATLAQVEAERSRLQLSLGEAEAERDRLQLSVRNAEAELADLRTRLAKTESDRDEFQEMYSDADRYARELEARRTEADAAAAKEDARAAELQREAERYRAEAGQLTARLAAALAEAEAWRTVVGEVASTPAEAGAQLRQYAASHARAAEYETLATEAARRLQALTGSASEARPDGAFQHGAERQPGTLTHSVERMATLLEGLYRERALQLFHGEGHELAPRPGTPLLERFARLERLSTAMERMRTSSPRAGSVPLLVLALDRAGQALEGVVSEGSPLEGTELAPGTVARGLREMSAEARERWHDILLAAASRAAEPDGASADPSLELLRWLLENRHAQLLTQMLRLAEVINVYFRDAQTREAELVFTAGQQYAGECKVVVHCLRSLGLYMDAVRFLRPPPADAAHFQFNPGRPLLLTTPRLHDIIVSKVKSDPRRLAETVADVSDWGFQCQDLPYLSKPTRGWLCSGLNTL